MSSRIMAARIMTLGALLCGVIGLLAGFTDNRWKLGPTGWFTGGVLLAVLALARLADEYFARHGKSST